MIANARHSPKGWGFQENKFLNEEVLAEKETAEVILSVDDGRAANDSFKLNLILRPLTETRLKVLNAAILGRATTSGDEVGANVAVRGTLDRATAVSRLLTCAPWLASAPG